jgi:hypothetical protein
VNIHSISRHSRDRQNHPEAFVSFDDVNRWLPALSCLILRAGGELQKISMDSFRLLEQIVRALPNYEIPIACCHK